MTLFSLDKAGESLIQPQSTAPDVLLHRKAHATDSQAPRSVGTQSGGRLTTKNDQIIAHDGTVQRIIFGRLPDGSWGIAISKPGVDVATAFS